MRGSLHHPAIEDKYNSCSQQDMGAFETAMSSSKNDNYDVIVQKVIFTSHKSQFLIGTFIYIALDIPVFSRKAAEVHLPKT